MTTGPGGVLPLLIVGDITNPGAVIINAGGTGNCFEVTNGAQVWLTGMTLTSTGSGIIAAANGGVVQLGAGLIFGSCTSGNHMTATTGALIQDFGIPYTVNGSAVYHWVAAENGGINITGPLTITLNNALTFTYFAHVDTNGVIYTTGNTGSGNHVTFTVTTSVTGGYYDAESNGVIQTFASGNSYFPGTSGFQPVAGPGTTPYGLYV